MIIQPYSEVGAQNYADFPAVKHWFKCDETAGQTTWSDDVGGVVCNVGTITTAGLTAGAIDFTHSGTTPLLAGSMTPIGTKITMIFGVGKFAAAQGICLGNGSSTTTGTRINAKAGTTGSTLYDTPSTNLATNTDILNAVTTQFGLGSIVDFAGNFRSFQSDLTTASWLFGAGVPVSGATPASLATGISATDLKPVNPSGSTELSGWMMLQFATMPSDRFIRDMVTWQTAAWAANDKRIYPGLKGVAGA